MLKSVCLRTQSHNKFWTYGKLIIRMHSANHETWQVDKLSSLRSTLTSQPNLQFGKTLSMKLTANDYDSICTTDETVKQTLGCKVCLRLWLLKPVAVIRSSARVCWLVHLNLIPGKYRNRDACQRPKWWIVILNNKIWGEFMAVFAFIHLCIHQIIYFYKSVVNITALQQ